MLRFLSVFSPTCRFVLFIGGYEAGYCVLHGGLFFNMYMLYEIVEVASLFPSLKLFNASGNGNTQNTRTSDINITVQNYITTVKLIFSSLFELES